MAKELTPEEIDKLLGQVIAKLRVLCAAYRDDCEEHKADVVGEILADVGMARNFFTSLEYDEDYE